jgi:hypothetical protein
MPPVPPAPVAPAAPAATAAPTAGIPEGLKEEIFFDLGGEFVKCDGFDPSGPPLQITFPDTEEMQVEYQMCVYGFPEGEQITVTLFAPAPEGDIYASSPMTSTVEVPGTTPIARVNLWMPVGLPTGTWLAIAQSDSGQVQNSFDNSFAGPAISTVPEGEINPFESHKCATYQDNEKVIVNGVNYAPFQEFSLGIYLLPVGTPLENNRYSLNLVDGQSVKTRDHGEFSIEIIIEPSDPAGGYLVILASDPDVDVFYRVGTNNDCYNVP